MPCDSRIEIRISWANADAKRAQLAIDNLRINARFDTRTNEIVFNTYGYVDKDAMMQRINAEYASLTIQETAERYGWTIENTYKQQDGSTVFEVAR